MNNFDSYSVKDMQKIIMSDISEIQTCIENIEGHLSQLNSKVATHEVQIKNQDLLIAGVGTTEGLVTRIANVEKGYWKIGGVLAVIPTLVIIVLHFI